MRIKELHEILQRKKKGKVTQNDIARAIGTSRANVSKLFAKNSFINDEKIKNIEKYFDVKIHDEDDISTIDYYPDKIAEVKNDKVIMSDRHVNFKIPSRLLDINSDSEYFICHAIDNSMYPYIINGDFIVVKVDKSEIENGKIYLFIYDGGVYIRRLTKNIKEIVLEAENKDYNAQSINVNERKKIYLLGKVVNIIRTENRLK